jgi:LmbE family N-acetylglucosaminyl deacetylase
MTSALILAAHPDDAEIAVGGTIALLRSLGWEVAVAVFTTGTPSDGSATRRRQAAEQAAGILDSTLLWPFDGHLVQVEDVTQYALVSQIDRLIAERDPTIVLAHCTGDSHRDHAMIGEAARSAMRISDFSLYEFAPSEHRTRTPVLFEENTYIDISDYEDMKKRALEAFADSGALGKRDIASLQTLWRYWGSRAGVRAAEALRLVRQIGFSHGTEHSRAETPTVSPEDQ